MNDVIREVLADIRTTLDKPTVIDAKINCRNLTHCLQRVEQKLAVLDAKNA